MNALLALALLTPVVTCPPDSTDSVSTLSSDVTAVAAAPAAAHACSVSANDLDASALNSAIDGAQKTLFVKLVKFPGLPVQKKLVAAAKRGVDVHVYLVSKKAAGGKTVLDAEGLEANGVDIASDTDDDLLGAVLVADDSATVPAADCSLSASSDAAVLDSATKAFGKAIAEPESVEPKKLAKENVRLLGMPESTGAEIAGLILGATKSIDLEIYQLQSPAIVQALIDAAKKNHVKVRVMLEPKTVGARNYDAAKKALEAAGINVLPTPPAFDTKHNVDHAKFMVIDGTEMIFGTGNLVRSGTGGNRAGEFDNRDFWLRDNRKQSVKEASALFEADWARRSTSGIDFKNMVVTPDNADAKILDLINTSNKRVYVWNQSLSDPKIVDALIAAKGRNADVKVLLGYQPGFGGAAPKNQAAIDKLAAAGISADYYTRNYLHAKGIVGDDRAYLGSQNFTNGGLITNREAGEIVDDADVVSALTKTFADDDANRKPSR